MRTLILIFAGVVLSFPGMIQGQTTSPATLPAKAFLFSYFRGNGEDGLHLAVSADGLKWKPLNNDRGYFRPEVGSQKIMRDPCVAAGPDGTFHVVWTTGWQGRDIGYAWSKDLIHWQEQRAIPVMEDEPATSNCWAPEVIYSEVDHDFMIFWASTIVGRFSETLGTGDKQNNHRIYFTRTSDFKTFSKAALLFDPGFEVIDGTILADGGKFFLFFKDETLTPQPMKHLLIARSDVIAGPYQVMTNAFTKHWVEGPTVIKTAEGYTVYFDVYRDHKYGAMRSTDLRTWIDLTPQLSMPAGARHGTVFQVDRAVAQNLIDHPLAN